MWSIETQANKTGKLISFEDEVEVYAAALPQQWTGCGEMHFNKIFSFNDNKMIYFKLCSGYYMVYSTG